MCFSVCHFASVNVLVSAPALVQPQTFWSKLAYLHVSPSPHGLKKRPANFWSGHVDLHVSGSAYTYKKRPAMLMYCLNGMFADQFPSSHTRCSSWPSPVGLGRLTLVVGQPNPVGTFGDPKAWTSKPSLRGLIRMHGGTPYSQSAVGAR